MAPEQMGRFICALRKEQGLTQKALAQRLQITDKAVSKWERGISCPDITLLPTLAAALGVTASELLAGARDAAPAASVHPAGDPHAGRPGSAPALRSASGCPPQTAPGIAPSAPTVPAKKAPAAARPRTPISGALRERCARGWTLLLLAGVLVCGICDLAVSGALSWSLYPAACCGFAWFVTMPLIRQGARGIHAALGWLTLLIGPFLFLLDRLFARSDPRAPVSILPVGLAMSAAGLLFLWGCFFAASWLKARPLRAGAACAGLGIAACLAVNALLAPLLNTRFLEFWDWLVMLLLAALAGVLLWLDGRPHAGKA